MDVDLKGNVLLRYERRPKGLIIAYDKLNALYNFHKVFSKSCAYVYRY